MNIDSLISWVLNAPSPPPTVVYRSWADIALAIIFIFFATYKGFRLVKSTRLGWSFAIYNFVMAVLFAVSIFVLPFTEFPPAVDGVLATSLRVALVFSVIWCVIEVEVSRKDMTDFPLLRRRGHGQQT